MMFGLLTGERVTDSEIYPQKSDLLTRSQTFMAINCFVDPKLYPLPSQISAILNKKLKIFISLVFMTPF